MSFLSAGAGADASRPLCRKAKEMRKERHRQKEQMRHNADGLVSPPPPAPTQTNQPKSLEDFISDSLTNGSSHCLEVSTMLNLVSWFTMMIAAVLGLHNNVCLQIDSNVALLTPVTSACVCVCGELARAEWKNHLPS